MKNLERSVGTGVARMLALGMVMLAMQAMADSVPQVVTVVKKEGSAQYSTDGRNWQTLNVGDVLKPGVTIRTAERSVVDILLGDEGSGKTSTSGPGLMSMPGAGGGSGAGGGGGGGGSGEEQHANVVRIFQSTLLAVDKLTLDRTGMDEVTDTQLDLRAGQIMGNVKKLSAQSHYEIKIPNGVAGIRGTGYLGSSTGVWKMISGALNFAKVETDGSVKDFDIQGKFQFDPNTDSISPIPQDVFGQLVALFNSLTTSELVKEISIALRNCYIPFTCPIDGTSL